MRPFWIGTAVLLFATACAASPAPLGTSSSGAQPPSVRNVAVNPGNIKRVARDLPPGYEVTTGVPSGIMPRAIWKLAAGARARPPQCAILADPGDGRDQSAQGVSGSGAGGVIDAIVVPLPGPVELDQDVVAGCGQWTMRAEGSTATVRLIDPPRIYGADTLGMAVDIKTSAESGTEIDSRAYTFTAYLGNCYAFTTVTTDPGSTQPALTSQFAADLLVKTVSTLRG